MKETCDVTNKSGGHVIYHIPELNTRRDFNAHEMKRAIPVKELEMLSQQAGGRELIYNYLLIEDKDILRYLINAEPEPEYFLKESEIPGWLNSCSLEEFQDALDFAPVGTKELIKQYSVKLKLNDMAKRAALKTQLNFDVATAIEMTAEEKPKEEATPTRRRATPVETEVEEEKPKRRSVIVEE